MQKLLFVLQSIGYGGSMTSLINLVSYLGKDSDYNIDVLFMDPYGELRCQAEDICNIVKRDVTMEATTVQWRKLVFLRKYDALFLRILFAIKARLYRKRTSEIGYSIAAKKYNNKYDCVIAFQESLATDFVQHIISKKKIAWIHHDEYSDIQAMYPDYETFYNVYNKYDKIVCVSSVGCEKFKEQSGISPEKYACIHNTLPVEKILDKKKKMLFDCLNDNDKKRIYDNICDNKVIKLVSVGRFVEVKRFDRVIEAASMLKNNGNKFKWFLLGDGALFERIEKLINERGLSDCVFLTGGLDNPFPVIGKCDLLVITSDFEANPMVANEALIVGTPVISTNYDSAKEVVVHGVNGLVCGKNSEEIAASIQLLLKNSNLLDKMKSNVATFTYPNAEIISQVKELLE